MKLYEGLFMFPPESGPDARKAEWNALEELFKKFGGKIAEKNEWGKRQLGYAVSKFREAYIFVIKFEMSPASVAEFNKALRLEEKIIKFMVTATAKLPVKKIEKKLPKSPSAGSGSGPAKKSHETAVS